MTSLPERYISVLRMIAERMRSAWMLTGSTGLVAQGIDLPLNDIDIITDRHGMDEFAERFKGSEKRPIRWSETDRFESFFGRYSIEGIEIEVMTSFFLKGSDRKRWKELQSLTHREMIDIGGLMIPVVSLENEYEAYRMLGRHTRAELIKQCIDS